jgi:hypothetical protein
MHGYPIYARWAHGSTDAELLPFLARVTRWLGDGRDVLFSEFGLPTYRRDDPHEQTAGAPALVEEEAAAAYTTVALEGLRRAGCLAAFLWCYSDYDPALWQQPPFDLAPHERTFGLWRSDGSPKPAVAAIAAFVGAERCSAGYADPWIDIDRDEFLRGPGAQLPRLYRRYREQSRAGHPTSGTTD